jgi:multimeric flavodoxin WrbA
MSNNPYIVIIYAGKSDPTKTIGANAIIANYIAAGVKKSGMNVVGPIDINFQDSQEEQNLITTITNSSGLIIGSGVYNGNIEPTLTEFFDNFAGAGFKSSFLASKVAGQFATAADSGTGGQLVLNSLSRLMQTFGAFLMIRRPPRSTLGKPGSGSWHTAQGILGIVTKDRTTGNPTFTNKYIQEDANAYGERIGQIASFFQNNYNKSMGIPAPQTGKTCKEFAPECLPCGPCGPCPVHKKHQKNNNNSSQIWLILLIILMVLFFMTMPYANI